MMNEITLHYKDRKIILKQSDPNSTREDNDSVFIHKCSDRTQTILNTFFDNDQIKEIIFVHDDLICLFNDVKSLFKYIEAAGGLVRNRNNELLVIHRFGRPDLPKGKAEKNETPEETAVREVEEECGISAPIITESMDPSYHIYTIGKERILKKTFWFRMLYTGSETLTPQLKEAIVSAEWCGKSKIKDYHKLTYPSIMNYFS
jgi:8-oxo-dGTP pyrophosphatase MutT (NUDIX family)